MLEGIFGNKTVEKILLSLIHYGEIHAQAIAKDHNTALNPIRKQLDRLEGSAVIISRPVGRMRLYRFNPKSPYTPHIKNIAELFYRSIPLEEREHLFHEIRKPRRKGKPTT
jgi:hypothetical protein